MAEHQVTSRFYSVVTNAITTSCRTPTLEFSRLRVSEATLNQRNDCGLNNFQSGSGGLLPAPAPKEPRRLVSKHSAQALISPFAEAGF